MKILAVDVGGQHVKALLSGKRTPRRVVSGPNMTAATMVDAVKHMTADWSYDAVSLGYPGPVLQGKPFSEPHNLAAGWVGFDFAAAFGKPVKVVNDAAMQALGSYAGGRMLFLGLGTGLGSAMIVDGVLQPMELAHLPYKKGRSYEDYLGAQGRRRLGDKKWRHVVTDVTQALRVALEADDVVIGGGGAAALHHPPEGARLGSNSHAFVGGFRLWQRLQDPVAPPLTPGHARAPRPKPTSAVFLFDVDNTLLDNDRVIGDLRRHLLHELGPERTQHYFEIFEALRTELGYADYLGALQSYRVHYPHDPNVLAVSAFLTSYPFANRLFPGSLDVLEHAARFGTTVIFSDGDVVFQPRKVERSGLFEAVQRRVLIYIHKEHELHDVERRFPAEHYVLVDDKVRILTAVKKHWGKRLTTVFPRQGHYATAPDVQDYPPADVTIEHIADLLQYDLPALQRAASSGTKRSTAKSKFTKRSRPRRRA